MTKAYNLLEEPLINTTPCGALTLPGVLAALARDTVEGFPALRPHQMPAWHMFLVQLAALALQGAGRDDIPEDEKEWRRLLRGLTEDFPQDEPWFLTVEDWSKPAFLQPPVPVGMELGKIPVPTPDALDLLITSKNHDMKQAIVYKGTPEDWLFSLISHQTGGTFSVQYSSTIRKGNSFAPRICIGFVSLPSNKSKNYSFHYGLRFKRDVYILIKTREEEFEYYEDLYRESDGIKLTWIESWVQGESLQLNQLDPWFIEVCRRIRLLVNKGKIIARCKSDKTKKINDLGLNGNIGDPWTPESRIDEYRAFSLSENGFNYSVLCKLFFGEFNKSGVYVHNWKIPVLARVHSGDLTGDTLLLVAQGVAGERTKTGTLGYYSKVMPISGRVAQSLGPRRKELHQLAQQQIKAIADFERALSSALALVLANGDHEKARGKNGNIKPALHDRLIEPRAHLDRFADEIFFPHLWRRFEAGEAGDAGREREEWQTFVRRLWKRTDDIFWQFLPAMPCAALYRYRAEARAESALRAMVRKNHPELFQNTTQNIALKTEGEGEHAA
jgi:CRISPR system Cascade subunit CasA